MDSEVAAFVRELRWVEDWVVGGYLAFLRHAELTATSMRHMVVPKPLAEGASDAALRSPALQVAQPGQLEDYFAIVKESLKYAKAIFAAHRLTAPEYDVDDSTLREQALLLMEAQAFFKVKWETNISAPASLAVKPKLDSTAVLSLSNTFQKTYRVRLDLGLLPDINVLRAMASSMEATGGGWPWGAKNLSFQKMGTSYSSSAPSRKTLTLGGTTLDADDAEGEAVGRSLALYIDAFTRKLYGVLLLLHAMPIGDSGRDGGGYGILDDSGSEEYHISYETVQRWAMQLGDLRMSGISVQQLDATLTTAERELVRLTSAPRSLTVGHALEVYYSPFTASVRRYSSC